MDDHDEDMGAASRVERLNARKRELRERAREVAERNEGLLKRSLELRNIWDSTSPHSASLSELFQCLLDEGVQIFRELAHVAEHDRRETQTYVDAISELQSRGFGEPETAPRIIWIYEELLRVELEHRMKQGSILDRLERSQGELERCVNDAISK
jgi:hypothetical protein